MAPEERRFTAAEWRDIHEAYHGQMERGIKAAHPDPTDGCDLGPFVPVPPPPQRRPVTGYEPPAHLIEWFASLSRADVERLEKLVHLRPETVSWIEGKNDRELKNLDGAVEFITSSRTAGRVLMWVGGLAVTIVGGATALAKNGMDIFSMFRGVR